MLLFSRMDWEGELLNSLLGVLVLKSKGTKNVGKALWPCKASWIPNFFRWTCVSMGAIPWFKYFKLLLIFYLPPLAQFIQLLLHTIYIVHHLCIVKLFYIIFITGSFMWFCRQWWKVTVFNLSFEVPVCESLPKLAHVILCAY